MNVAKYQNDFHFYDSYQSSFRFLLVVAFVAISSLNVKPSQVVNPNTEPLRFISYLSSFEDFKELNPIAEYKKYRKAKAKKKSTKSKGDIFGGIVDSATKKAGLK